MHGMSCRWNERIKLQLRGIRVWADRINVWADRINMWAHGETTGQGL